MPHVISETEIKLNWSDISSRQRRTAPVLKRSSGVHVSGVLKYVLTKSGYLKIHGSPDGDMPINVAFGMAWEDWVVGLWPKMCWQPGEVALDGILGSPDGITGKGKTAVLDEFKATWKSAYTRQDILQEKVWMYQLMAYCKMLGLTKARLHVLWINGSYRPPTPKYALYEIGFSKEELDSFWENVMLNNKENAVEESH